MLITPVIWLYVNCRVENQCHIFPISAVQVIPSFFPGQTFKSSDVNFYRGYDDNPCYLAPCENSSAIHDTLCMSYARWVIIINIHYMYFVQYAILGCSKSSGHRSFFS